MNGACALCLLPVASNLPGVFNFKALKDHVMALKFQQTADGAQQKIDEAKAGGNLDFQSQSIYNINKDSEFGFIREDGVIKLRINTEKHMLPKEFAQGSCIMVNTCNTCIQGLAKGGSDPSRPKC